MKKILYIFLLLSFSARATTYYVSPTGSDSNNGTSTSTPWQTITKVNTITFSPLDNLLFQAGQSFSGHLVWISSGTLGNVITIGVYGTGIATISSGSSNGFTSVNNQYFFMSNLKFTGNGITSNTAEGVRIENSQTGNTKLQTVTLLNIEVSQYGFNGISIQGTNGASGFNNVQILGCNTHDCTGNFGNGTGSSGIIFQGTNYGSGATAPNHTNILVDHCISTDNIGYADPDNWTGSGIVLGECRYGIVQYCKSKNNGLNSHGTVGIWCFDSGNLLFQYCDSRLTLTSNGTDGDGFDIDGGCHNIRIQFCWSQDNQGAGYQIYTYNDGLVTTSDSCTVAYCISQNDGTWGGSVSGSIMIGNDGGSLTNIFVINNTFYQNGLISNPKLISVEGSAASISGYVANNVLFSNNGANFIKSANTPALLFVGNNYYGTGTLNWEWGGTTYNTLSSWQSATGQEKISGVSVGKTSNPSFMSVGNRIAGYRVSKNSTILGQGLNLNTLYGLNTGTKDFYGNKNTNNIGGFDIGAYQFSILKIQGNIKTH